jgi:hypothetical protein
MKLLRVHQKLVSNPLADIRATVREQLDSLKLDVPQGDVGITAGSRGIANIAAITRAAGDWLREHGARPFLFPAMGSHNGGTAATPKSKPDQAGRGAAGWLPKLVVEGVASPVEVIEDASGDILESSPFWARVRPPCRHALICTNGGRRP